MILPLLNFASSHAIPGHPVRQDSISLLGYSFRTFHMKLSITNKALLLYSLLFIAFLASCTSPAVEEADIIFQNGDVLTMNDAQKEVEALAIKEGKILAVGTQQSVGKHKGENTQIRDLNGGTLLPGFIDGHSHFSYAMRMLAQANLSAPPVDVIRNIPDIIERLKQHRDKFNIAEGGWLLGWGYDPDQLEEGRHPNRAELSAAFPDHPVFIRHASFHMGVANDQALAIAGIDEKTPDPPSGVIVREKDSSKPNGLLQETAMGAVFPHLPKTTPEQLFQLVDAAQQYYAGFGITTVQDGLTDSLAYAFLKEAAERDVFYLDLEVLASFRNVKSFIENEKFDESHNRVRLTGLKVTTDGSPQGKTAFFKDPYLTEVPGCTDECRGYPMLTDQQLQDLVTICYTNNIQLYVHCNGDASIDMLLETHQRVTDSLNLANNTQRTVVIHSQFVREDQLDQYNAYGFIPSFFTNHAFFWGDTHLANLGTKRANFLSPMKTASNKGIIATNHTDYPVTPSDQLFLLWTSMSRTSRAKKILGEEERLSAYEGLKALTINGAYQHRSEDVKGSLEVGKWADLVLLDRNPTKVTTNEITDLQVLETIKEGKTIFTREKKN